MFILDTNAVSDLLKGTPKIVARFEAVPDDTPVVTWFEILMKGRYQTILTAADRDQLLMAARLIADEERLEAFDILPISEPVAEHFDRLLKVKGLKKIGRPGPPHREHRPGARCHARYAEHQGFSEHPELETRKLGR